MTNPEQRAARNRSEEYVRTMLVSIGGLERDLTLNQVLVSIKAAGIDRPMRTLNQWLKWHRVVRFVGEHRQDQRYRADPTPII